MAEATVAQPTPSEIIRYYDREEMISPEYGEAVRLADAAPDLLAALKALLAHRCVGVGCYNAAHDLARIAIEKAEAAR